MSKVFPLMAVAMMAGIAGAMGADVRFANVWEQGPRRTECPPVFRTRAGGIMQRHGVKKLRNQKGRRH